MARNNMEKLGAIWASRTAETAQGTFATSNLMAMPWESGSRFSLERGIEDDRDRITGKEGPTETLELNRSAKGSLSMDVALPDFMVFILAYFYGACTSSLVGSLAYEHVITPLASDVQPTFTACQKHADGVFTERFGGCAVEGFNIEIGDGFIKANMETVGLGKSQVDFIKATGTLTTATTLTLSKYTAADEIAGDGSVRAEGGTDTDIVAGTSEADRLANIDLVLIQKADGTWHKATATACTGSTGPSVVTFSGVDSLAGDEDFVIHYISAQAATWSSPPALNAESPLRLADASLLINGTYDGSIVSGGYELDPDWHGFTITGANNLAVDHVPGSGKMYAGRVSRGQRILTFNLSERMRDTVMSARVDDGDTLSLQISLQGALIETGYPYGFTMIVPSVGILGHDIESNDRKLAQKGDLVALEHTTYGIGKVLGYNKIASYI